MPLRVLDLNGDDWKLGQAPGTGRKQWASWSELAKVREWLPATVPGNVQADLIDAGRLPDLDFGMQAQAAGWADDSCWWLVRDFAASLERGERAHLILRGVDYVSDLFLNEHSLGRHEGMFSPQVYDVTDVLRPGNRLAVHILGSRWLPTDRSNRWEKLLNHLEVALGSAPGRFPHRRDTLKCQMGFGWDFAPPLRSMGIWDDVYMVFSGEASVRDLLVTTREIRDKVALVVLAEIDAAQAHHALLRCTVAGETFESTPLVTELEVDLVMGLNRHALQIVVPEPHLWWPWDHGQPDLYRVTLEVWDRARLLDSVTQTTGLREIELKGWTLHVNGQPVFARGANWVPADLLPGCVTSREYGAYLQLARKANMNLLRVWGGGLREKQAFYDQCDRIGILVWQEFPFACASVTRYPRSREYLQLVRAEARGIVRDLRAHPSVAVWCGGNEFHPNRNADLVSTLRQVVQTEDPTRPFLSASPAGGDSHNWHVWHQLRPPATYRQDTSLFASEFGLQAPPDTSALRQFIPPAELWPPGPSWEFHGAGLTKLWRYALPFLAVPKPSGSRRPSQPLWRQTDLEAFVRASQQAQACGLQIAIEHYRRLKAVGCGGALVWQFNEPWPAISWALVDFFRNPKPGYHLVRRLMNPVLVSLDYPLRHYSPGDPFCADVWVINDSARTLRDCQIEVTLWYRNRRPANQYRLGLDVPAHAAVAVDRIDWAIPQGNASELSCLLTCGDQVVTENGYDLAVHDDYQPGLKKRFLYWLSDFVKPA